MNASFRDLKRDADTMTPPSFDIEGIVERGDARLRRRRAAFAAAAAVMVVAVIITGTALTGPNQRSGEPTNDPAPSKTEAPAPTPARQLTYTDDYVENWKGAGPRWLIQSIQYGDQILRPGVDVMHMDVTDDGLALVAKDGGVYFADASSVERIGEVTIHVNFSDADVKTDSVGSLVAWFTPAEPETFLVVYDTHERQVVARVPVPGCRPDGCRLDAVVGNRVYWTDSPDAEPVPPGALIALDVPSGTVFETDEGARSADIRANPRGLVKGDSFANGEVVNMEANFTARGSSLELRRLVRETDDGEAIYGYGGFDTTGRRLDLRLPDRYTPAATDYTLFQWLDDDRFAVMSGAVHNEFGWNGFPGYGDILVCNIAKGRCTLADNGPTSDRLRLVPHLDAPN
jgi:hypothetical protein